MSTFLTILEEFVLFTWMNWIWCFIEMFFFFLLFQKKIRFVLAYSLSRYFLILFTKIFIDGHIVSGIFYVPSDNISWIFVFIFLLAIDALFICEKRSVLYRNEYMYNVQIRTDKYLIDMIGYLDTGNKSTNLNTPIIVLNKRFFEYFKNVEASYIQLGSIHSIWKQKAYCGELSVEKGKFQKVWIILSDQLYDVDCLLNIYNV